MQLTMEKPSLHATFYAGKEQGQQVGSPEPSSLKQTHVVIAPQIPEGIRKSLEYTARCLMTDCLKKFQTEDMFPTVDEFSISSEAILHVLVRLGVPTDAWKELSQKILTILKQIESLQHLHNYDSQINNEKMMLINSLKDAIDREKRTWSTSFQLLVDRMKQLDEKIAKLSEKQTKLLEEKHLLSLELQKKKFKPTWKRRKTTWQTWRQYIRNFELIQKSRIKIASKELQENVQIKCLKTVLETEE